MTYLDSQIKFLKSYDFMRLGHAISSAQWQAVAMATRRMEKSATECEYPDFAKWFKAIRQCAQGSNKSEALQIMTLVTQRRVKLLNELKKDEK